MSESIHYAIEPEPYEPIHWLDILGAFLLGAVVGAAIGIAVLQ